MIMSQHRRTLPLRQRGFTLIEIMVALAISAVLLGGIIQVFVSLKQTDKISSSLSRMQESARVATDILSYDARLAGYAGCIDPMLGDAVDIIANNAPIQAANFLDSSLQGWEVTAAGWGDTVGLGDIDGTGSRNARTSSDVFRVQHFSTANVPLASAMANRSSDITIASNILGLEDGDLAVVADCQYSSLFRVSGISGDPVTISHADTDNNSNELTTEYGFNALLTTFVSNTYFVGDTGRRNINGDIIYALFMRDSSGNVEEIVEGIEHMQIRYGHEFNNNNIRFVNASDGTLAWNAVTSIKIALLLASNERILEQDDNTRFTLQDVEIARTGTTITYANDRRLRRAINISINLRNRRI